MQANTIRGAILGLMFGAVIGGGVIAPKLVDQATDKVADKVVDRITHNPKIARSIIEQIPKILEEDNLRRSTHWSSEEERCMAKNIYHEAGVEEILGKVAVGQVTMNRLQAGRWGNTICEVVFAKAQFSWTLSKKKVQEDPEGPLWDESLMVARAIMINEVQDPNLNGVLFYHTDYISTPHWADENHMVTKIGQHIFYTKAKMKSSRI